MKAGLPRPDVKTGTRSSGNVVALLDPAGELAVALGDVRLELVERPLRGRRCGEDQVDPERLSVDPLPDPLDVGGDLVGRVHRLAEDRESARVHDRGDDVLAVGERDDRELDPQHVAELRAQRILGHGASSAGDARRRANYRTCSKMLDGLLVALMIP
jgi:hypothetical protein